MYQNYTKQHIIYIYKRYPINKRKPERSELQESNNKSHTEIYVFFIYSGGSFRSDKTRTHNHGN